MIRVEQRRRTDDRYAPTWHPRHAICTMLDRRMRLQSKSLEVADRSASAGFLRRILMTSRWLQSCCGQQDRRRCAGSVEFRCRWAAPHPGLRDNAHATQACAQAIEAVRSSERITLLRLPDGAISRLVREITTADRVAVRQVATAKCVRARARDPPPIIAPSMRLSVRHLDQSSFVCHRCVCWVICRTCRAATSLAAHARR